MRLLDRVKTGCNGSLHQLAFDPHAPMVGVVDGDAAYRYSADFRLTREPVPGDFLIFAEHCGLVAVRREDPRTHRFSRLSNQEPLGVVQRRSRETEYGEFCLLPDGTILAIYEDSTEPGVTTEVIPAGADQPAERLLLPLMALRANPQLGLGIFLLTGDCITRLALVNLREFYIGDQCYNVGGFVWSHDLSADGASLLVVCEDVFTERLWYLLFAYPTFERLMAWCVEGFCPNTAARPFTAARQCAFSPNGRLAYVPQLAGDLAVIDVRTREVIERRACHETAVVAVARHPALSLLATLDADGELALWEDADPRADESVGAAPIEDLAARIKRPTDLRRFRQRDIPLPQ